MIVSGVTVKTKPVEERFVMRDIARILLLAVVLLTASSPAAFAAERTKLVIGVTPFPNGDLVRLATPLLAAEGYDVEVKMFNDEFTPNIELAAGRLSANIFQGIPHLEEMASERELDLTWVARVYFEPLGLYSTKLSAVGGFEKGDTIASPSDPAERERAPRLLEKAGLIKLDGGGLATVGGITENKTELEIVERDATVMARDIDETTASVIGSKYAVEANIMPVRDALLLEDNDSPHTVVVAARKDDADKPEIRALAKAINSQEVRKFLEDYLAIEGIVPAF
jgi:D-methionine transport system substrate-binding protein